jgi:hypothetical protein
MDLWDFLMDDKTKKNMVVRRGISGWNIKLLVLTAEFRNVMRKGRKDN